MTTFEQEWVSPILEVFKKGEISETYSVILGLNPLGQAVCRRIYERKEFETALVFNSPSFSVWNRYPIASKPPVIPVHGMVSDELMLIFGDVLIREYEWVTDLLFYLRGNVPTRFVFAFQGHDQPTCGQVLTKGAGRILSKMDIPSGQSDFYDGLTAPLISIAGPADLDPIVVFLETTEASELLLQTDETTVTQADVDNVMELLERALNIRLY